MEPAILQRSIWIDASCERTWHAVTEPEQLAQWYAPGSPWEIPTLEVGASITFFLKPSAHNNYTATTLHATIEELEVPYRFGIRWEGDPTDPASQLVTTLVLTEEKGGTRVTMLTHGVDATDASAEGEAPDGWGMSLHNLKAVVEGEPVPYI